MLSQECGEGRDWVMTKDGEPRPGDWMALAQGRVVLRGISYELHALYRLSDARLKAKGWTFEAADQYRAALKEDGKSDLEIDEHMDAARAHAAARRARTAAGDSGEQA